jgi:alkanesulfonate monooxygenase SsuD/methylene tetrahydromethanopterin reductase-like flavin-dependent oxidoreductase (luciferase family)
MAGLRFGTYLGTHPPAEQFALVRRCEALGLDSVWTGDHVSFHHPLYDSLTLLASYAGITSRIELGSGVYLLALRRPAVVAKITSTLDVLCGGRLIFGVGVGGENPKEFEACGVPHRERGAPRQRGDRRRPHAVAGHAGLVRGALHPVRVGEHRPEAVAAARAAHLDRRPLRRCARPLARKYGAIGTPAQCVEQIERFAQAGCRYFVMNAIGDLADETEQLETIASEIIPRVQKAVPA